MTLSVTALFLVDVDAEGQAADIVDSNAAVTGIARTQLEPVWLASIWNTSKAFS